MSNQTYDTEKKYTIPGIEGVTYVPVGTLFKPVGSLAQLNNDVIIGHDGKPVGFVSDRNINYDFVKQFGKIEEEKLYQIVFKPKHSDEWSLSQKRYPSEVAFLAAHPLAGEAIALK